MRSLEKCYFLEMSTSSSGFKTPFDLWENRGACCCCCSFLGQALCFLNASQASLNGKEWGDAIKHATSALEKGGDKVKALYRRGLAR